MGQRRNALPFFIGGYMNKIWLVVSRRYDGYMSEKVKIYGSLQQAKTVGDMMLHTKAIKYEIYEDGKDYIGDFRVKPVYVCNASGNIDEVQG
jgi:hypothetical protein